MGLLSAFKALFETVEEPPNHGGNNWDNSPPTTSLAAQEVTFNPTPSASYERQLGRLLNLYRVRNVTPEVTGEIERYRNSIKQLGYNAPMDVDEAEAHLALARG